MTNIQPAKIDKAYNPKPVAMASSVDASAKGPKTHARTELSVVAATVPIQVMAATATNQKASSGNASAGAVNLPDAMSLLKGLGILLD